MWAHGKIHVACVCSDCVCCVCISENISACVWQWVQETSVSARTCVCTCVVHVCGSGCRRCLCPQGRVCARVVHVCGSGCRRRLCPQGRVCAHVCRCCHARALPELPRLSHPHLPQGCSPRAWSSTLLPTTTQCVKVTTPPSGTSLGGWGLRSHGAMRSCPSTFEASPSWVGILVTGTAWDGKTWAPHSPSVATQL